MGETQIPAQPKRVVALDQSFVDAVLTLDTEVVGYTVYRGIDEKLPSTWPRSWIRPRTSRWSARWRRRAWSRSSRSSPT
nr:hypothetical protein GCM10020093_055250 [Planobispora longispora]